MNISVMRQRWMIGLPEPVLAAIATAVAVIHLPEPAAHFTDVTGAADDNQSTIIYLRQGITAGCGATRNSARTRSSTVRQLAVLVIVRA